jgi:hypothetical protein
MTSTREIVIVIALAATGCRTRGATESVDAGTTTRSGAAPAPAPTDAAATSDGRSRPSGAAPLDAIGTIYPRDLPAHPLATRLCDALHAGPARRKAECCGGEPAPFLATECARVLGATLHAQSAELDEAAVQRCAAAMADVVQGCDWVTPQPPSAPESCQNLVKGKLGAGSVCRSSLECEGKLHCAGVSPTKTGVCTPPGALGDGCGTHADVLGTYVLDRALAKSHPFCADFCSLVTHKCSPEPAVGSTCLASVNCAPSQTCVSGRCSAATLGGPGEPCGAVPCAEGLRCVARVCAPLARTGEACSSDADCAIGGCVRDADGRSMCGAKCTASLDALRARDGGVTLRLPSMPRDSGTR